jgi:hypothetical protein
MSLLNYQNAFIFLRFTNDVIILFSILNSQYYTAEASYYTAYANFVFYLHNAFVQLHRYITIHILTSSSFLIT